MWAYENCCFCIELRTGCFIIAYLLLISYIIISTVAFLGIGVGQILIASTDPTERPVGFDLTVVSGVTLLFVTVSMVFTIVLLVGLHKNKPGHVKLFLVYSLVFLVFFTIMFIAETALTKTPQAPNIAIICGIVFILVDIYCLLIIRSYWIKMNSGNAAYRTAKSTPISMT